MLFQVVVGRHDYMLFQVVVGKHDYMLVQVVVGGAYIRGLGDDLVLGTPFGLGDMPEDVRPFRCHD
jgi:hypothetical protein